MKSRNGRYMILFRNFSRTSVILNSNVYLVKRRFPLWELSVTFGYVSVWGVRYREKGIVIIRVLESMTLHASYMRMYTLSHLLVWGIKRAVLQSVLSSKYSCYLLIKTPLTRQYSNSEFFFLFFLSGNAFFFICSSFWSRPHPWPRGVLNF